MLIAFINQYGKSFNTTADDCSLSNAAKFNETILCV